MNKSAEVIVATHDPAIAGLVDALRAENIPAYAVTTYVEAGQFAARAPQCVAVVDGDLSQEAALEISELLQGSRSVPTLMLVSEGSSQRVALDSHPTASVDYVPKPIPMQELVLLVKAMILRAGYSLPPSTSLFPLSLGYRAAEVQPIRQGSVVAVFSAKGGVGKSTIAVNLAVGLSRFYRTDTLLADADLWFGDVGTLLNLNSKKSIFDLCSGDEPEISDLQRALLRHESGIAALLRPPDLVAVEKLDIRSIVKVLATYRKLFDYVIVNMHSALDELNLQILDLADRILLVTTPEMSATVNTARFLGIADTLGYTSKISLILNRANYGINVNALEQTLGMAVSGRVVSAGRLVVGTANEGRSLFSRDPGEEQQITRDLAQVVELVAGQPRADRRLEPKRVPSFLKQSVLASLW